jgi:hypothetical protein
MHSNNQWPVFALPEAAEADDEVEGLAAKLLEERIVAQC